MTRTETLQEAESNYEALIPAIVDGTPVLDERALKLLANLMTHHYSDSLSPYNNLLSRIRKDRSLTGPEGLFVEDDVVALLYLLAKKASESAINKTGQLPAHTYEITTPEDRLNNAYDLYAKSLARPQVFESMRRANCTHRAIESAVFETLVRQSQKSIHRKLLGKSFLLGEFYSHLVTHITEITQCSKDDARAKVDACELQLATELADAQITQAGKPAESYSDHAIFKMLEERLMVKSITTLLHDSPPIRSWTRAQIEAASRNAPFL